MVSFLEVYMVNAPQFSKVSKIGRVFLHDEEQDELYFPISKDGGLLHRESCGMIGFLPFSWIMSEFPSADLLKFERDIREMLEEKKKGNEDQS